MKADEILEKLEAAGFEAYYVGGCVRDALMKVPAHDFDVATNALPEQVMAVFDQYKVIPTGIRHGTITVFLNDLPVEITTYRIDGNYSDNRHPDNVRFSTDIITDLERRDFTMNALAMDLNGNMIDKFGGIADINNKILRCVGEPAKRFSEDALRIMRAIRFSSRLGFKLDKETSTAVHKMQTKLVNVSNDRIRIELDKLICGKNSTQVLLDYSDVITTVIPEFAPCIGFDQRSDYHCYDVWEHIVHALSAAPVENLRLRRSLLFHDIAKPQCAKFDADGKGHFKGHAEASAEQAKIIMNRLHYDKTAIHETSLLISCHSDKIKTRQDVKRMLKKLGPELFFELIEMKKCDNLAKKSFVQEENKFFDELVIVAKDIILKNECYKISQLEINGSDLLALGFDGIEIGRLLDEILSLVIDDKLNNKRTQLLEFAKGMNE